MSEDLATEYNDSSSIAAIAELFVDGDKAEVPPADQGDVSDEGGNAPEHEEPEDTHSLEEHSEGEEGADSEEPEPEDTIAGVTIAGLAEKLGVDASDIYNELQIPVGDGETITLGQYKDRARDLMSLDTKTQVYNEQKAEHEKGQIRDRALLNEMMGIIGPEAARPALEAAQKRLEGWAEEQREQVFEAIPEWKDTDNLARDRQSMINLGAEYGFSETEIAQTQDAKTIRMLRDFALLREQQKSAKAASKKKRAMPGGKGKQNRNSKRGKLSQVLTQATNSTRDSDKSGGIAALLQSEGIG